MKWTNRNVRWRTCGPVRQAMIQLSLYISTVWSESSVGAVWIARDVKFLRAVNKDSDQTARMRRLIWVVVGRTCQKEHFITLRLRSCYCRIFVDMSDFMRQQVVLFLVNVGSRFTTHTHARTHARMRTHTWRKLTSKTTRHITILVLFQLSLVPDFPHTHASTRTHTWTKLTSKTAQSCMYH